MDITQSTDMGKDSASVDWASPGAVDNSGSVRLTASIFPGESFNIGETNVTYTAVDSNNNMLECRFTVTITGRNLFLGRVVCEQD